MSRHFLSRSWPGLLLVGALWFIPEIALAEALTASQSFVNTATSITSYILIVLNFFAWLMLSILDHIMDPQYIFALNENGGDGNLFQMLHKIWQFCRDLVNVGFALGLIVGAVIMIVTGSFEKLNEHKGRFVLAIILVNFSWFIPRVIFDVSQVMTYTVYQLPSMLGADNCTTVGADGRATPCVVVVGYKFFEQTNTMVPTGRPGEYINEEPGAGEGTNGWRCPLPGIACVQMVPITEAGAQVRSATKVLEGLVVNHARLQTLAQIRFREAELRLQPGVGFMDSFQAVGGILLKLVIVVLLHIAIVFPLMAMVSAFFIRIPVLWVSMAFMPLIALGFVFKPLQGDDYGDLFWKWKDHFLQAVFLPVRVAVPFTIGFIMLNAGGLAGPPDGLGEIPLLPIFVGVRDLWQFLWMGIAMYIIWEYSFKALKSDKAGPMGMFTDKIQGIGTSLGSIATQWPLSWQFIPMPGRNAQTGEQNRISPLQALHGLDLNRMRGELGSLGHLRSFEERIGLGHAQADAAASIRQNQPINNQLTLNIQRAAENAGNANGRTELEQGLKTFRAQFAQHATLNDRQIVDAILRAGQLPGDQIKQRMDALQPLFAQLPNGGGPPPAA